MTSSLALVSVLPQKTGHCFTPVEIVDFIVKSVDEVLKEHFGRGLMVKMSIS